MHKSVLKTHLSTFACAYADEKRIWREVAKWLAYAEQLLSTTVVRIRYLIFANWKGRRAVAETLADTSWD